MLISQYHAQIIADVWRCLAVAGFASALGWSIGARLPRVLPWWLNIALIAPLFTPALLISYTYAPVALRLTAVPWAHTVFYSALIAAKLIPLAALARRFFPPRISPEALFCAEIIPRRPRL